MRECNKVAEAALCYTGDILDPRRDKYDLKYYVDMAKELAADPRDFRRENGKQRQR